MRPPTLLGIVVVSIAAALGVATAPGTAHACSCGDVDIADYAPDLAVAFAGTQTDRVVDDEFSENGATLTFDVERVYLGNVTTPFTVRTNAQESGCGVDFDGAGPVAVVARTFDGEPTVGLCERPTVDDLVATFGPGTAPAIGTPATGWRSNSLARALLLSLLGAVIVSGGFVVVRRGRD